MLRSLILALLLLLPFSAAAQTPEGPALEGSWALEIDGTTIFRFDIEPAGKEGEWRATWSRPSSFASDGNRFAKLTGPPEQVKSMAGVDLGDQVELSFNDPRPGAIPDIFRFRLIDPDAAEMIYVGTDLAPYILERVASGARIGPWDQGKVYVRETREPAQETPPDPDDYRLPAPPSR